MEKYFVVRMVLVFVLIIQCACISRRRGRRRNSCPLSVAVTEDADPKSPVVTTPKTIYVNEPSLIWVSPGNINDASKLKLAFFFANDSGPIPNSDCQLLSVSGKDKGSYSELTLSTAAAAAVARSGNVSIVIKWQHQGEATWREMRKQIDVVQDSTIVLIQTNKAVFNPRQTVTVTIYTLNRQLIPVSVPVEVDVLGPNGVIHNRTLISTDHASEYPSAHRLGFQFPALSLPGTWTIRARYGMEMKLHKQISITLENYRLPTFTVHIDTDDMKVIADTANPGSLHVKVTAQYVFGSPVQGSYLCSGSYVKTHDIQDIDKKRAGVEFKTWNNSLNDDGTAEFDVSLELLKLRSLKTNIESIVVYLRCDVTECLSGVSETSSSETILKDGLYSLSFESAKKVFKPGLPYFMEVQIKDVKGGGAENVSCTVSAMFCSTFTNINNATQTILSNDEGKIYYIMDTPSEAESICIKVVAAQHNIEKFHKITPESNATAQYLSIVPDNVNVGKFSEFLVHASHPSQITALYALHIMRGTIHEQVKHKFVVFTSPQRIRFDAVELSAPRAEVVVFYFTQSGGENVMVSDSVTLEIKRTCDSSERVETDKTVYEPKDAMTLTYYAHHHTTVVSQATDVAALALGNSGVLTSGMLQQILEINYGRHSGSSEQLINKYLATQVKANDALQSPDSQDPGLVIIEDCCQWGKTQDWNSVTSPCQNIALKQLDCANFSKECMEEALRCCISEHETSGDEINYYEDYYFQIDDNPISSISDEADDQSQDVFNPIELDERQTSVTSSDTLRQNFQESVVFPLQYIRHQTTVLEQVIPDSLTSWQIQTVFLNKQSGICVAPPTTIQVRKDTFLRIALPARVVFGEHFEITAVIYNHRKTSLFDGFVRLVDVADDLCHDRRNASAEYPVRLGASKARKVYWVLKPDALGEHDVTVKLTSRDGTEVDAVRETVHVEKAGVDAKQRTDIAILRSDSPHLIFLKRPEQAPAGSHVTAVIQFYGNLIEPNSEMLGEIDKNSVYARPDSLLVQTSSLLHSLEYMNITDSFQSADLHNIEEELSLAVHNLITFQDPVLGCVQKSLDKSDCDVRLTKFTAIVLAEMVKHGGLNSYKEHACSALFYTFISEVQGGSNKQLSCLYKIMNDLNCQEDERIRDYFEDNILARNWTCCEDEKIAFESLMKAKDADHFNNLAYLLELWTNQTNTTERHQRMQLKMTEVSTEDIEDAAWLLRTAAHNNDSGVADSLASWMLMHRDAYGTFVTYSDTVLALISLREYTRRTFANSVLSSSYSTCKVSWAEGTASREEREVILSDPSVTQALDVSDAMGKNASVECTGGLTFAQTHMSYHIVTGDTPCLLNINATAATHQRPRSLRRRGRGKRAADCSYDAKNEGIRTHKYRVRICLSGLAALRHDTTEQLTRADLTVSLFSGYIPARNLIKLDRVSWDYIPSSSSIQMRVELPQEGDEHCVEIFKHAKSQVANVQPGLVVVKLPERDISCSLLYHTDKDHPLLDTPTSCS